MHKVRQHSKRQVPRDLVPLPAETTARQLPAQTTFQGTGSSGSLCAQRCTQYVGPAPHGSNFWSGQLGPAQARRLRLVHSERPDSAQPSDNYLALWPCFLSSNPNPSGKLGPGSSFVSSKLGPSRGRRLGLAASTRLGLHPINTYPIALSPSVAEGWTPPPQPAGPAP